MKCRDRKISSGVREAKEESLICCPLPPGLLRVQTLTKPANLSTYKLFVFHRGTEIRVHTVGPKISHRCFLFVRQPDYWPCLCCPEQHHLGVSLILFSFAHSEASFHSTFKYSANLPTVSMWFMKFVTCRWLSTVLLIISCRLERSTLQQTTGEGCLVGRFTWRAVFW